MKDLAPLCDLCGAPLKAPADMLAGICRKCRWPSLRRVKAERLERPAVTRVRVRGVRGVV